MRALPIGIVLLVASCFSSVMAAQQVADSAFRPPIARPAYPYGRGPVVLIDEAHANFHTASGRYFPFAELLRRDGYVVRASADSLSPDVLRRAAVLVTANAREAFSPSEVTAVRDWLHGGGALLLIVDHPPFVQASADLALALGIRLNNTGVGDPSVSSGRLVFRRSDSTLADHVITIGIDSVATFTGSSLQLGANGQPLLLLGPHVRAYDEKGEPDTSVLVRQLQGGVLELGRGRVAVFGEAAMFSAQLSGPSRAPMGMNAPIARQNAQFLLNVVHWLTRRL